MYAFFSRAFKSSKPEKATPPAGELDEHWGGAISAKLPCCSYAVSEVLTEARESEPTPDASLAYETVGVQHSG